MDVLPFTTDSLPPDRRLAAFRQGAADFHVEALGDPLAFGARWRLLIAGEVNLIESWISPVHYRRTRADIAADGADRVAVLFVLDGHSVGTIDDKPISVGPGDAMILDLLRPLDTRSPEPLHTIIATLPRFLLDEALPISRLEGSVRASAEVALACGHIRHLLDHAPAISPESAVFHGRAVRDLVALALLPAYAADDWRDGSAPLLAKIHALIDRRLTQPIAAADIPVALDASSGQVAAALASAGGWASLVEQRRLLAAYRLLCAPDGATAIATIGERCGFPDAADFSRRFRQSFGASPRKVRARHQGELPRWAGAYHVADDYRELLSEAMGEEDPR